jgi:cytochrome c peroxidase
MRGDACSEAGAMTQAAARVSAIEAYRTRFAKAFALRATEAITEKHLARAIAAFERSLVTANTPFDRFMRGDQSALNQEQQRGMKVFTDAGCNQCHGGPMLSDYKLHFIGVQGERRPIRTPSLRNITHTTPFMHNGSIRTLRDVLTFYELLMDAVSETIEGGDKAGDPPLDPLLKQLDLKAEDFPALEAFLGSLSDSRYDGTLPKQVPSGLPPAAGP